MSLFLNQNNPSALKSIDISFELSYYAYNQPYTHTMLEDFILYLQTNNYSPKTVYNYKQDLLFFENYLISNNLTVESINKKNILEFKAYLSSDHRRTSSSHNNTEFRLSSSSINRCLSAIRAYLRFLIEQDVRLQVMPDQFKMVKRDKLQPHVAELEDLVKLIESPSNLESDPEIAFRNRAILEVLFATGMRISELVALNRFDINNSGRILITGKGRKQRFVYLTERAKLILDQYLTLRKDSLQALFIPTKGKNISSMQRRISPRYIQDRIKKYREILKINLPVSPHSLRHGFATYLAEEGASPVAIQMLLGHESLNTTTRYVNASDHFAQDSHKRFHPLAKKTNVNN